MRSAECPLVVNVIAYCICYMGVLMWVMYACYLVKCIVMNLHNKHINRHWKF